MMANNNNNDKMVPAVNQDDGKRIVMIDECMCENENNIAYQSFGWRKRAFA